jgi:hypothetical protein
MGLVLFKADFKVIKTGVVFDEQGFYEFLVVAGIDGVIL